MDMIILMQMLNNQVEIYNIMDILHILQQRFPKTWTNLWKQLRKNLQKSKDTNILRQVAFYNNKTINKYNYNDTSDDEYNTGIIYDNNFDIHSFINGGQHQINHNVKPKHIYNKSTNDVDKLKNEQKQNKKTRSSTKFIWNRITYRTNSLIRDEIITKKKRHSLQKHSKTTSPHTEEEKEDIHRVTIDKSERHSAPNILFNPGIKNIEPSNDDTKLSTEIKPELWMISADSLDSDNNDHNHHQ
mmetsp:Transcript_101517/g.124277  ORF Transcript_101517/g.124277 Transcript_101517/m.124277 type:complete len:243 (+) Transcript_101517:41-769(+)